MDKKTTKPTSGTKPKRGLKITLIVTGVLVALYILSLFVPFVSGYTKYPLYLVKCGGAPVSASKFAAAYTYHLPSERFYQVGGFNEYFCTEAEAQVAGYRHSTLQ